MAETAREALLAAGWPREMVMRSTTATETPEEWSRRVEQGETPAVRLSPLPPQPPQPLPPQFMPHHDLPAMSLTDQVAWSMEYIRRRYGEPWASFVREGGPHYRISWRGRRRVALRLGRLRVRVVWRRDGARLD